jgi:hypothetical protein
MGIRRKIVGRAGDGRTVQVVIGDALPWKYDNKEDAFHVVSTDGQAKYVVAKSRPTGTDNKGHKLYRYWMARVNVEGETYNLGDEYMIASEGRDVCEIYDSARIEGRALGYGDNTRRIGQRQDQKYLKGP